MGVCQGATGVSCGKVVEERACVVAAMAAAGGGLELGEAALEGRSSVGGNRWYRGGALGAGGAGEACSG